MLCFHCISETILFTVHEDDTVRAGLPPKHFKESYAERAAVLGKFQGVSKIAFSPKGDLYAVRGNDLYVGPMPSAGHEDWFSSAKRVGKVDWNDSRLLFFHPNGELYVVTTDGMLYKGPAPDNEHVSWFYGTATKIGDGGWESFDIVFFDPKGMMHAVVNDGKLLKRSPPTSVYDEWRETSAVIGSSGWRRYAHFMAFTPDGKMWCVETDEGKIYYADPPVEGSGIYSGVNVGIGYTVFRLLAFTSDKTIQKMISFEFLPDLGKTVSQSLEIVKDETYRNSKSSVPLKHTFTFQKTMRESSSFSHDYGLTVSAGTEITFKAGIPKIAEEGIKMTVDVSTTNTWNFTKSNETEVTFSASTTVEVPGGKSIRIIASVVKAEMEVPYRAKVRTAFGYETTIEGTWRGVSHFNLTVEQEDI
ncbi:uncharacterized protein LOC128467612 [Spea bombifrons]|uniref:uncharacterized protein LOC128467612 n=1 Tax=Spea bombifrons TaxID=233779 RepID=UPI00234B345C|nr:uncharacterized protein LOC128467612 [Spea bombifrons]